MNKKCKDCGSELSIDNYYKNNSYTCGYDSKCKDCCKQYQKVWRINNKEKHREYSKQYQSEHKQERADYYKDWSIANADKKAEYDRAWKINHPERMKDRRRIENARRRARLQSAGGSFTVDEWLDVKEYYDCTCLICGNKEPDVKITPDHVVPLALGGSNEISNIQPLCWGCNAGKQARYADYR